MKILLQFTFNFTEFNSLLYLEKEALKYNDLVKSLLLNHNPDFFEKTLLI